MYWRSEELNARLYRHRIFTRSELAKRSDFPVTTIYLNFPEKDWSGRVHSLPLLVWLCEYLDADLTDIVQEPRQLAASRKAKGRESA